MPKLPEGQYMWVAYLGEVRRVRIVEKGVGGVVFKRGERPQDPYVIHDEIDEEDFVLPSAELYHNPREAQIAAKKLAKDHGFDDGTDYSSNPTVVTPGDGDGDDGDDGDDGGDGDEEEGAGEEDEEGEYDEDSEHSGDDDGSEVDDDI